MGGMFNSRIGDRKKNQSKTDLTYLLHAFMVTLAREIMLLTSLDSSKSYKELKMWQIRLQALSNIHLKF